MQFSQIIGNEQIKSLLEQMVVEDHLSHAILLTEDGEWGAMALAVALAQRVNCENSTEADSCGVCDSCHKYNKLIHPDLHFVFPVAASKDLSESEKKAPVSDYFIQDFRDLLLENPFFTEQDLYDTIGIENKSGIIGVHEAKRIFDKLSLRAFEGKYKTMIIYLPEKMNQEAANKLLKLLEEPPAGTLFIMVSHAPERIMSTIRSRCQRIQIKPLSAEERKRAGMATPTNPEYQELLVQLLRAGLAKSVVDTFPVWEALADMGREKQKEWCVWSEIFIRKIFMTASSLEKLAEIAPSEEAVVRELAGKIKPTFYEKAFKALESAISSIGSNVNAKLTFCNLSNILLLSL